MSSECVLYAISSGFVGTYGFALAVAISVASFVLLVVRPSVCASREFDGENIKMVKRLGSSSEESWVGDCKCVVEFGGGRRASMWDWS